MDRDSGTRSFSRLRRGALVAVGFSFLGLYLLSHFTGGVSAWRGLTQINPWILALTMGLVVFTWVTDALRISILVRSLGGHIRLLEGVRISVLGAFVSNVTPFDTGGEPVQAYLLVDNGMTAGQSSAIIAVKAILNASARLSMGLIVAACMMFLPVTWHLPSGMYIALGIGVAIYVAVFLFALYLVMRPEKINVLLVPLIRNKITLRFFKPESIDRALYRIDRELHEFRAALDEFLRYKKATLAIVMLLSLVSWLTILVIPAVLLRGLGIRMSYLQAMGISIVFYLAAAYAPTPGSSGAAELGFAALFSTVVPTAILGLFVTIWRLLTYYFTLLAGGVLMLVGVFKRGGPKGGRGKNESDLAAAE